MARQVCWSLLVLTLAAVTAQGQPPPAVPGQRLPVAPQAVNTLGYTANWYQNLELSRDQQVAEVTRLGELILVREKPRALVTALEIDDGSIRWQLEIGEPDETYHTPVRRDNRVFFSTPLRLLEVNARNGEIENRAKFDSFAEFSPVVIGEDLIFGASNGRFFAFNIPRNIQRWRRGLSNRLLTPPVKRGNEFFVADAEGHFAVYNGVTAQRIWAGRAYEPIRATATMDEDTVYIPSMDQTLYAINHNSGIEQWTFRAEQPLKHSVYRVGQYVFLPLPDKGLVALDHSTGEERWRLDEPWLVPITQNDGQILMYGEDGLTLVQANDGVVIGDAVSDPLHTVIAGPDSSVILTTPDGRVQRLNLSQ